jgi:hypothetical protein
VVDGLFVSGQPRRQFLRNAGALPSPGLAKCADSFRIGRVASPHGPT